MPILNRKKAKSAGLTRYFTGKPCKRGHISERFVSSFSCIECVRERNERKDVKEKLADWMKRNKENKRLYDANYKINNPRDRSNEKQYAHTKAKRRAAKIQRTPKWLTEDDLWMIAEIYDLAERRSIVTRIAWHVDHIIPLQGKLVSGLHVPSNLQVIIGSENRRKHNSWSIA